MTESTYLGGFVGTEAAQAWWLEEKVEGWRDLMAIVIGVVGKLLQTAHTGPQKFLQQEWFFVQRITSDIGMAFQLIEHAL